MDLPHFVDSHTQKLDRINALSWIAANPSDPADQDDMRRLLDLVRITAESRGVARNVLGFVDLFDSTFRRALEDRRRLRVYRHALGILDDARLPLLAPQTYAPSRSLLTSSESSSFPATTVIPPLALGAGPSSRASPPRSATRPLQPSMHLTEASPSRRASGNPYS